ncbi:Nramp family divalent metal transporter [Gilvibacter sediminis]|uniref:Nramp family divalent metal transporter n=1 Tax=Gilvibacter sediminis TaxID=379071 RepID=UPI00234FCA56|nr:Nramp family divalent metal transporter [Gilvibacter sediminis]MDC7998104.1 Nramp family divalent metal transporter [Gilvibacter sediminis]
MRTPWYKKIGPATLIAAAFIGPGTVTVCTLAGVNFGMNLLWALLLSMIATIILQEMAARLGLITGNGLAAALRAQIANKTLRNTALFLVFSAIIIGNSAYEAGNISGGVLGLRELIPNTQFSLLGYKLESLVLLIGVVAFFLLYIGRYKILERVLMGLVLVMSLCFLITAVLTAPDLIPLLKGLFIPSSPGDSLFTIIALIGTTVVPYNLFLHAALVSEKWSQSNDLKWVRRDTVIAVGVGGLVSMAILVCGAALQGMAVNSAADLGKGLEPLLGGFAKYFIAIALFAAGITSAITAPLAAAYVARGCFGWNASLKDKRFRAVWMAVLFIGVFFALTGSSPIAIIQFAQVANGIVLPLIAIFLLWAVNRSGLLGKFVNSTLQNLLGIAIIGVCLLLSGRTLYKLLLSWMG